MTRLIGLSGSLRQGSYNTALLHAAAMLVPAGTTLIVKTIHGIPLYNGDDEANTGIPTIVRELKENIIEADGLIFSTPEYNHSIPGVFKNAIDWLSRPGDDIPRVFGGKPVALLGATPGSFGTVLSQNAWLPILHTFGTKPWFGGHFALPQAFKVFNPAGQLIDAEVRTQLQHFVAGFVQFVDDGRNHAAAAT